MLSWAPITAYGLGADHEYCAERQPEGLAHHFQATSSLRQHRGTALSDDPVLVLDDGFMHRLYLVSDW